MVLWFGNGKWPAQVMDIVISLLLLLWTAAVGYMPLVLD